MLGKTIDRRTLLLGSATCAVASLSSGQRPALASENHPSGYLVTAPLGYRIEDAGPGIVVLDLASDQETFLDVPPVDGLIPVTGTSYALAWTKESPPLEDALPTSATAYLVHGPTATLAEISTLSATTDLLRFAGLALFDGTLQDTTARWAILRAKGGPFLVDLKRATVADLNATFGVASPDTCYAVLVPGRDGAADRMLVQSSQRLLVADPSTLAVLTEFRVQGGVAGVVISPAVTRIAWSEIDPATGGRQVCWSSLDGGDSTTVYAHPGSGNVSPDWLDDHVGFGWVDDETLLAWPDIHADEIPVTKIDLTSRNSEVLTTVSGRSARVWLMGNGGMALVEYSNNDGSIPWLAIPTAGGALQELPELAGMQFSALPEKDSAFAFLSPYNLSNASGRPYLLLDTGTLTVYELISADRGRDHGIPAFSPDGCHALISRWWEEPTTVFSDLPSRGTVVIDGAVPASYSPGGRHVATWDVGTTHEERRGLQLRTLDGVVVREFNPASWLAWVA